MALNGYPDDSVSDGAIASGACEFVPGSTVSLATLLSQAGATYENFAAGNELSIAPAIKVTYNGSTYVSGSGANYIYAMPAPLEFAQGSGTVSITSASGSNAAIYYTDDVSKSESTFYRYIANNLTAYTAAIPLDRNMALRAVAVWAQKTGAYGYYNGISYDGQHHFFFAQDSTQTIPSHDSGSQVWYNSSSYGYINSDNYYYPVVQRGSTDKSQVYIVTVPTGYKYALYDTKLLSSTQCGMTIKLEKLVGDAYQLQDADWYTIPTSALGEDIAPALTAGTWRLTLAPESSAAAGQAAMAQLGLYWETNQADNTYPPLDGPTVTASAEGMTIDVSDLQITDVAVDEIFAYLTNSTEAGGKGLAISAIGGATTEAQAKANIKTYVQDQANYASAYIYRRAQNSTYFSGLDYASTDTWTYFDAGANLQIGMGYVYRARVQLKSVGSSDSNAWSNNIRTSQWLYTSTTKPFYTLLDDTVDPQIASITHSLPGGIAEDDGAISKVSTIFATVTDNQHVSSVALEYKLANSSDDFVTIGGVNTGDRTSTQNDAFWYMDNAGDLQVGSTYTFRITVVDASQNQTSQSLDLTVVDAPAQNGFTVRQDSSSLIISWTPQQDYYVQFCFYDSTQNLADDSYFTHSNSYNYSSSSSSSGNFVYTRTGSGTQEDPYQCTLRAYIDAVQHPNVYVAKKQRATNNYSGWLADVYAAADDQVTTDVDSAVAFTTGADDEAPQITRVSQSYYNNAVDRYAFAYAIDDSYIDYIEFGVFTRSGSGTTADPYVYTPIDSFLAKEYVGGATFHDSTYAAHSFYAALQPGVYYVGARAADVAGHVSGWSYSGSFTISSNEYTYPQMQGVTVTAGQDRFVFSVNPTFDQTAQQEMKGYVRAQSEYAGVTDEQFDQFFANILDYVAIEYGYRTSTSSYYSDLDDCISDDGEWRLTFTSDTDEPRLVNLKTTGSYSSGYNFGPALNTFYSFVVRLVKNDSAQLEDWMQYLLPTSEYDDSAQWFKYGGTTSMGLADDSGAPDVSDITNSLGNEDGNFVDNSAVLSVDVSDGKLIDKVVWQYQVNDGQWCYATGSGYTNTSYNYTALPNTQRVSSMTTSVSISDINTSHYGYDENGQSGYYDQDGNWINYYYDNHFQNGDVLKFRVRALDAAGNWSEYVVGQYVFQQIDPPTNVSATAGNAQATVTWDKVDLPQTAPAGTAEYGYRVYAYQSSSDTQFSTTDVDAGVTSATIPLDSSQYTGSYYFNVRVLTSTGGLGNMSDASNYVTPGPDTTNPEVWFDQDYMDQYPIAGTKTNGYLRAQVVSKDNNYVSTVTVSVQDSNGNEYATDTYTSGMYFGQTDYWYFRFDTQDLGTIAGASAVYDDATATYRIPDGTYTLVATVVDYVGNTASTTWSVIVDNTEPDLTGATIAGVPAVTLKSNGTSSTYESLNATISWTIPSAAALAQDDVLTIRSYAFSSQAAAQAFVDGTASSYYPERSTEVQATATTVDLPVYSGYWYVFTLTATDAGGNASDPVKSAVVYAGEDGTNQLSIQMDGASVSRAMFGDTITVYFDPQYAGTGVEANLYRLYNNSYYWLASSAVLASGLAGFTYTIPTDNTTWSGTQTLFALYYSSDFRSAMASLDVDFTLAAPSYVNATGSTGKITVQWGSSANATQYVLYRSTSPEAIVADENLLATTASRTYADVSVTPGTDYYYAVVARTTTQDGVVESDPAQTSTAAVAQQDTTKPVLTSVTPDASCLVSASQEFAFNATDNVAVVGVQVEYKSYDDATAAFAVLDSYSLVDGKAVVDLSSIPASAIGASQNVFLRFKAYDAAGNYSQGITNAYAFGTPLAAPQNLIAQSGEREIVLGWNSVLRLDVTGYRIYRAIGTGEFELLADVAAGTDTYTDTSLDPTVAYSYQVCALYQDGDATAQGQLSSTATALPREQTTSPTVIYLDPLRGSSFNGNLDLMMVASDKIVITGFIVEYAYLGTSSAATYDDSTTWIPAGQVTSGITQIQVDETLLAGLGHSAFQGTISLDFSAYQGLQESGWFVVRVRAMNNGGEPYASAWYYAKYKYDSLPPDDPTGLAATDAQSGGTVIVEFDKPGSDVHYTQIKRSTTPEYIDAVDAGVTSSASYTDTGLTDDQTYYYWAYSVDRAGNVSGCTGPVTAVPTSVFVLELDSVTPATSVPVAGKQLPVTVTFTNNGPARASGQLELVMSSGATAVSVGTWTFADLAAGKHSHDFTCTVPADADAVMFTATIDTTSASVSLDSDTLTVNHAPIPVITADDSAQSGTDITLAATQSTDPDDESLTFVWNMGDGTVKNGDSITYRYALPGTYTVTLTATDQRAASATTTKTITVTDNRPDLQVGSIAVYRKGALDSVYTLVTDSNQVQENDAVRVEVTVTNNSAKSFGPVPTDTSFLVGFYLNGIYQGYRTVTGGVPVGAQVPVSTFDYTAKTGAQVIKIVANDLLDNLKESDKQNNSSTVTLNASQVDFAEIAVTGATWINMATTDQSTSFTSQQKVIYQARVSNETGAAAATFKVSLYVDATLAATQSLTLAAGEYRLVSFQQAALAGSHEIVIAADDPTLVEQDSSNNSDSLVTPEFTVSQAQIDTQLAVEYPQGMTNNQIAQGGTLTLTATLTPDSDISDNVSVKFYVDDVLIKTVTVPGGTLVAGQPYSQSTTAKWVVQDGIHVIRVVTDSELMVLDQPSADQAETVSIVVVKPDLWLSDVTWAPADTIEWGGNASFMVRVSNRSVATLYQPYVLTLWAAALESGMPGTWSKVASRTYNGIQGNSTSVQILNWTPKSSGEWAVVLTLTPGNNADFDTTYYDEIDWSAVNASWKDDSGNFTYDYSYEFVVSDGLVLTVKPNQSGELNDFGANMFVGSSNTIPVTASMTLASNSNTKLNSVSDGAMVTVTLTYVKTGDEDPNDPAPVTATLSDRGTGDFSGNLITAGLPTGSYLLTYTAQGGGYVATYATNIIFVDDIVGMVTASNEEFVAGELVTITGNAGIGSTPYVGSIVLDLTLAPCYGKRQPDGTTVSGEHAEEQPWYRGEKVIYLESDANGNFSYTFKATSGDAGRWSIKAYAMEKLFGSGITGSAFTVYGMEAKPAQTTVTAAKNTNFTATVNLYNSAWDGSYGTLTGVSATLLNGNAYDGITAVLDSSAVRSTLNASASFPVALQFFTDEDCVDTAEYIIEFSSIQGASATATVVLSMRPGTPKLYADQSPVVVASNPGTTVVRTVTITNKGIATMNDIVTQSGSVDFIRASLPSKTSLAPGESLTFDITFAPTDKVSLGTYQDTVTVTNGVFSLNIPVGLELTGMDYGTVRFVVTDDFDNRVDGATITLYGRDPYTQHVNGKETTYYVNHSMKTQQGVADTSQLPCGTYDYTITASGKESYTGVCQVLPSTEASLEEAVLTTLPVEITWTVTETTITDEYEINLTIDVGVTVPEPQLGSTIPWFTIGKQMQSVSILETRITNNSLIDVIDAVATVDSSLSGFSIVGGNYIGTIPAMSSVLVQILVQPGLYNLPAKGVAGRVDDYAKLVVKGSYVSYDPDTQLPEYPAKTTDVKVPIFVAGTTKVNVEYNTSQSSVPAATITMPEDVEFEEMDYLLFKNEGGGQIPYRPSGSSGSVYEVVKLELSQTASLERQAFDAELTIKNNYPSNSLDSLTVEVVLQYTDPDTGATSYITDNVYIIQNKGADVTSVASGSQYDGTWKIIPGVGLGGESGKTYSVFARISYMVGDKLVNTTTDAIDIFVKPLPQLVLDYYLPHTIYPNQSFRIGVSATNTGTGTAQNVILDSSQLEVVSNTSGLLGTWQITGSSFGSAYDNRTYKLTLGDIPGIGNGMADDGSDLPNSVWGYYTVLWSVPELSEGYLDDVYGTINDFTASITHKPYEGVELDPLIIAANTHIVAKDDVAILDENDQNMDNMSVIVGPDALPQYIRNGDTNLQVQVYVPLGLSGDKVGSSDYRFTAPIEAAAQTADNADLRYMVLMVGESADLAGVNIVYVYRYDTPDYSDTPVVLSYGNYWKDTYTVDGEEMELLYVVDEVRRDDTGAILPRYYRISYGSALQITGLVGSNIMYQIEEKGNNYQFERLAVFYDTGRFHDQNDQTPLGIQATVHNPGKNPESGTVYLYRAPVSSGVVGSFTQVGRQAFTVGAYDNQLVYFYIDLYANSDMPAGDYVFRAALDSDADSYLAQTQVTINALPIANAGVDFNVIVNKTAVFDASRSYDPDGHITSFVWDFGDGESGWGIAPTHVYLASGTYIATLLVTDSNGTENAIDDTDYLDGRPTTSYAIHNVMVTVHDDRPDIIIVPNTLTSQLGAGLQLSVKSGDGEFAPVSSSNPVREGDTVRVVARIMNDKPDNPVPASFYVALYRDNEYMGFQRVEKSALVEVSYNTAGGTTVTTEYAEVTFELTADDNLSHLYTVRANDISYAFDEADMFNNQRTAIAYGASGRSIFPDVRIATVTVDGKQYPSGSVSDKALTLTSGQTIPVVVTLVNGGDDATGEFAVTAKVNGKWADSVSIDNMAVGETRQVTLQVAPEEGTAQQIVVTADGPYPHIKDSDRSNNTWTHTTGDVTIERANLTIDGITVSQQATTAVLTALVTNSGSADALGTFVVTFYANERYIGESRVKGLAAGASTTATLSWANYTAATAIKAVADAESNIDESSELDNIYVLELEGQNVLEEPALPVLTVTDIATVALDDEGNETDAMVFGSAMRTTVTLKNTGTSASTQFFVVSLFAQGQLAGEAEVNQQLQPAQTVAIEIEWVADKTPTGSYIVTALADSEYNVQMTDRSGIRMDQTIQVAPGIAAAFRNGSYTLVQGAGNEVLVTVVESSAGGYASQADVRVSVRDADGVEVLPEVVAVYDGSTGSYRAVLDLASLEVGTPYELYATAVLEPGDGASPLSDTATADLTVCANLAVTVDSDASVYQTGDTVAVSGTTVGANTGDKVTVTLTGDQVWSFATTVASVVDGTGSWNLDIDLPASAGGAMTLAATVANSAISKRASTPIYVYGAYFTVSSNASVVENKAATFSGNLQNIGYLDLEGVTITATAFGKDGQTIVPIVKFMTGGRVYQLDSVSAAELAATNNAVVINGELPDYAALPFSMQADATGVAAGDYTIVLTATATAKDRGPYIATKQIDVTVVEAEPIMDVMNLDPLADDPYDLYVNASVSPDEMKTYSFRVVNLGTANLEGVTATLLDKTGAVVPWTGLTVTGGVRDASDDYESATIYPYYDGYTIGTAEGAVLVTAVLSPYSNTTAALYNLNLVISANDVDSVTIPVTVHVTTSAQAIGTTVLKVVADDGTIVSGANVTLYGPVSSQYSAQEITPSTYTGVTSDPVLVGDNLSLGGTVQFTNIPSGIYTITITGQGIADYTGQIEVLPTINLAPRTVEVAKQVLVIQTSKTSDKKIDTVTADANDAYYDAVYKLATGQAYDSNVPSILPDYPLDELEVSYIMGVSGGRLAIKNPDLNIGDATHSVTDVTISIVSSDIAGNMVWLRGPNGPTSTLQVGTLAPDQTFDFVWNVDTNAFFVEAYVEAQGDGTYTLTLPQGYNWNDSFAAWSRENSTINTYGYLSASYKKVSISDDGSVLVVEPVNDDVAAPGSRVPLYTSDEPVSLQFTLLVSGKSAYEFAQGSTTEMKDLSITIPVQIDFVPNGYYLESQTGQTYTSERIGGAFSSGSNANFKYYSQDFLSSAGVSTGAGTSADKDGFSLAFRQDMLVAGENNKLTLEFANPSTIFPIENLTFRVIVSDMPPDATGAMAEGATYQNGNFFISPSIVSKNGITSWKNMSDVAILDAYNTNGYLTIDAIDAGGSFRMDFDFEALAGFFDNAVFASYVEAGYMTQEEASRAAEYFRSLAGTSYAWIEYSFMLNGRMYSGHTAPVDQTAELGADLSTESQIYQREGESPNIYYLAVVITNSGYGDSDEITLVPPMFPTINGSQVRLIAYVVGDQGEFTAVDLTSDEWYATWADNAVPSSIPLGTIGSGKSKFVVYKFIAVGGAHTGVTIGEPPILIEKTKETVDKPEQPKGKDKGKEKGKGKKKIKLDDGKKPTDIDDIPTVDDPSDASIPELIDDIEENLSTLMYATVGDYAARVADAYTVAEKMWLLQRTVSIQQFMTASSTFILSTYRQLSSYVENIGKLKDDAISTVEWAALILTYSMGKDIVDRNGVLLESLKAGSAALTDYTTRRLNAGGISGMFQNIIDKVGHNTAADTDLMWKVIEAKGKWDSYLETADDMSVLYSEIFNTSDFGSTEQEHQAFEANLKDKKARFEALDKSLDDYHFGNSILEAKELARQMYRDTGDSRYLGIVDMLTDLSDRLRDLNIVRGVRGMSETVGTLTSELMLHDGLQALFTDWDAKLQQDPLVKEAFNQYDNGGGINAVDFIDDTLNTDGAINSKIADFRGLIALNGSRKKLETFIQDVKKADSSASRLQAVQSGLKLMEDFTPLKPLAQFMNSAISLTQEMQQQNAMVQAMGSYGATTVLTVVKLERVIREDTSTGALTASSPLVIALMDLVEEAVETGNALSPNTFKPFDDDTRKAATAYMVKYLNKQRAMYTRDESSESNWMKAHVTAALAAMFEQCYVSTFNQDMSEEGFLKFMLEKSNAKGNEAIIQYTDANLVPQTFQEMRIGAVNYMLDTFKLVQYYGAVLPSYSSYPAKQIAAYLTELNANMAAAAQLNKTSVSRYKTLTVWELGEVTDTQLTINTNNMVSFRDWQQKMLDMDVINNENYAETYTYQSYALQDLFVRTGLMIFTFSPNVTMASLGATMSMQWDMLSKSVFAAFDEVWAQKSAYAATTLAGLSVEMGKTITKESTIGKTLYDMMLGLDNFVIKDPPFDVEVVTFAMEDSVCGPNDFTGTGQAYVTFRNDSDVTVQLTPIVDIYDGNGYAGSVTFEADTLLLVPGEQQELVGRYVLRRSTLQDATGYSAVLNYTSADVDTNSIAAQQGPFVVHFYVGTQRAIAAMRSNVDAGTIASAWLGETDKVYELTGKVTASAGQVLRIFATAAVAGGVTITVTDPDGIQVEGVSYINDGDYVSVAAAKSGDYTVTVSVPQGFDGRVTVEGVRATMPKAVVDVITTQNINLNANRGLVNESGDVVGYTAFEGLAISESAGRDAGAFTATLEFDEPLLSAVVSGTTDQQAIAANAAWNGGFTITADPSLPNGTYAGTLTVSFDASTCDPALLSARSVGDDAANWQLVDGRWVFTTTIYVTADLTRPDVPTLQTQDGDSAGTLVATGTAPGAQIIMLYYTYDQTDIDDDGSEFTHPMTVFAGMSYVNDDGTYSIAIDRPALDSQLFAVGMNAQGGTSDSDLVEVEAYEQNVEPEVSYVADFSEITAKQTAAAGSDGATDNDVSIKGSYNIGSNVQGSIYYRVVKDQPEDQQLVSGQAFDATGWTNAGVVNEFTVHNVYKGQYIQVVQLVEQTVYGIDDATGDSVVIGTMLVPVRNVGYVAVDSDIAPVYVTSVTLPYGATIGIGETMQLEATIAPSNATDPRVTWASSDESIATVDQNGVITGIASGVVTITATTMDLSDLTASCLVTVVKDINSDDITVQPIADQDYTGAAATPAVVVMDGDKQLVAGTDYMVRYYDADGVVQVTPQDVGTYTVRITGIRTYANSRDITFNIVYAKGDVNMDGAITAEDAQDVLDYRTGLKNLTEQQLALADMNDSGTVTAIDAALILHKVAVNAG